VLKLPRLSGEEVVKILVKNFGFEVSRHKGSHVILRKFSEGRKILKVRLRT
jgi:predicted RNA binding protein YcfA (HicA-like mRNA interferase family)